MVEQDAIARLESIHESDRAVLELIAAGEYSLPALRNFLLKGKLTSVFQPRLNAVAAVAKIGGKDILIEYLKSPILTRDPVILFGEEAVRSSAARELARWPASEVRDAIMDAIRERLTPGACEAAARLRLISAAPYLLDALADDVCRPPAMDALREMLPDTKPLLMEAALRWAQLRFPDDPVLFRRAQAAIRILSEADLSRADAQALSPMLASSHPEVVVCACRILLIRTRESRRELAGVLVKTLASSPWFIREEIRELLILCGAAALAALDYEIELRSGHAPVHDDLLPTLVNIRSRIRSRG